MRYTIEAACGCDTGRIRKNNEDNFSFHGQCLALDNNGLEEPLTVNGVLKSGICFGLFDGMGGENFGEYAAYAAARQMNRQKRALSDFWTPAEKILNRLAMELNNAVLKAQQELRTDRMGSTMVCLYFSGQRVYACNIGDSRAYRLRNSGFLQISLDHVEQRPGRTSKKAPLTQHLGIDPQEMEIEPFIFKGDIQNGDTYLLCSDGLTDMLSDSEISDILRNSSSVYSSVQDLIRAALDHGGRDNVTVIVCKITEEE